MKLKKLIKGLLITASLLALVNPVQAAEIVRDKFKFAIGGYALMEFDSYISLTDPDLGLGVAINPADTLGTSYDSSVLRLEGYYRFTPKHSLTYSWYSIDSTGSKTLDEEFEWSDDDGNSITIPVGAQVESSLGYDIWKIGYLWSFHHTDKIEMGFGGGLHITRLKMSLNADATNPPNSSIQRVNTLIPLPVISLVLKYHVTPKFHWYLQSEAFALKYDDWFGSYRDTTVGMEYRFWEHVALGAGLSSNSLDLEEDAPTHKLRFNNSISGALLYVSAYF